MRKPSERGLALEGRMRMLTSGRGSIATQVVMC